MSSNASGSENEKQQKARSGLADISTNELLRMLITITGRLALTADKLRAMVVGQSRNPERWVAAYNACDGSNSQAQIVAMVGVNQGDFSSTIARWVAAGIVFRVGTAKLPLGLYPLPTEPEAPATTAPPKAAKERMKRNQVARPIAPQQTQPDLLAGIETAGRA